MKLKNLHKELAAQFREAARMIAENESEMGCSALYLLGGDKLTKVFSELIFPAKDRGVCCDYTPWLGSSSLSDGTLAGDHWSRSGRRNRRVVGLLLCAEFVPCLTRAELISVGYDVTS